MVIIEIVELKLILGVNILKIEPYDWYIYQLGMLKCSCKSLWIGFLQHEPKLKK